MRVVVQAARAPIKFDCGRWGSLAARPLGPALSLATPPLTLPALIDDPSPAGDGKCGTCESLVNGRKTRVCKYAVPKKGPVKIEKIR